MSKLAAKLKGRAKIHETRGRRVQCKIPAAAIRHARNEKWRENGALRLDSFDCGSY
jgi:hypothetical protein